MLSLREQSFRNFEHIVVDGLSSDKTLEVVRNLGDDRLRILSEKDSGLYDAMNKGLRMARGKYVLFLNAGDCFSSPEELTEYARAASEDCDVIYADTQLVNGEGKVLGPRHLSVPSSLTYKSFLNGMLVCHQAFMVRRELAPEYDLRYRFSSDYDWCIRCLKKTVPERCRNLERVAVNYLTDGMTDKNKFKSLRERFDVMKDHYGLTRAVGAHLSFIPRAVKRHLGKSRQ